MSNDDIIDTLNDLIETCKDGEYGFRASAEYVSHTTTRQSFERRAEDCRMAATELQGIVTRLGGKAEDGGTTAGAMHRGWVAVKGTLAGYTDKAILDETERGEDNALSAYCEALETSLPPDVRLVVERQYAGVKRNHQEVRALRDPARTAA